MTLPNWWRFLFVKMLIHKLRLLVGLIIFPFVLSAQWLSKQNLIVNIDIPNKEIAVNCTQVWPNQAEIKVFLDKKMIVDSILCNGTKISFYRKDSLLVINECGVNIKQNVISYWYHGKPKEAVKPPWDGGFIWKVDKQDKPFISTAVQDIGSQIWWPIPSKFNFGIEHSIVTCTYPKDLFFKGNGRLIQDFILPNSRTTSWETKTPISAYNICLNIGDFNHFSDTLLRIDGSKLSLDFYPLSYNKNKAIKQFEQVKPMLICYEMFFGEFPAQDDGFSIVEAPFAGMEHQSAIAYGNNYQTGYSGNDYSGIGLDFDFIIIHESGHEWWGNSVKACNSEDFWLQEAFCTYAEYIYVKCLYNDSVANKYINHKRTLVTNGESILSGKKAGIDMYSKGSLMIRSLQNFAENDSIWFTLLKLFAEENKHTCLTTQQLIKWWSIHLKVNLTTFFKQYLETTLIPKLTYSVKKKAGNYIYKASLTDVVDGFRLPVLWKNNSTNFKLVYLTKQPIEFKMKVGNASPDLLISYFEIAD